MAKRAYNFAIGAFLASVLVNALGCKPGQTIPAPTTDPTQIVQAHLTAINSKDPAKIHRFVASYCIPSMQAVEHTMLWIGTRSAPFTFQKLDSSSNGRIVAEVKNGNGVHEFLSAKLNSDGKISGLLLGPPPITNDQATKMVRASLAAVNSKDPAKIHAFFAQYADPSTGYLEKYFLGLANWTPYTFDKIASNGTGQVVAEVHDRSDTRGYFTARIASSGKIGYLGFGVPYMSNPSAAQIIRAYLAALNSKDQAEIHDFVANCCVPSMEPVEKTMLTLGSDGPYVMERISSNSDGTVTADVANGRQEHCYLCVAFNSKNKVEEILLSQL